MPITNTDPLLGHEAQVTNVQSGGFVVRQLPAGTAQPVDTYASNMDAVSTLLTQIFTPPTP
jgi:hypothetical protein